MIIKTYVVEGMTCNGCKTEVEEKISAIPAVVNVSVNLQDKKATIKATNAVDNGELQSVLPAKYKVNEYPTNSILDNNERDTISKIKQLTPLFLIFIYIISGVLLIHRESFNPTEMMMDFMGLFFITFSFFKILDLKGFSKSFQLYDPLAKVLPGYAMVYPFIEITLGLLFLLQTYIIFALILTIAILGITTMGVTKALFDKKSITCACLGTTLNLPMTEATLIENAIMIVMAFILLFN